MVGYQKVSDSVEPSRRINGDVSIKFSVNHRC